MHPHRAPREFIFEKTCASYVVVSTFFLNFANE